MAHCLEMSAYSRTRIKNMNYFSCLRNELCLHIDEHSLMNNTQKEDGIILRYSSVIMVIEKNNNNTIYVAYQPTTIKYRIKSKIRVYAFYARTKLSDAVNGFE